MDWAMRFQPMVMSIAMVYYCWRCLQEKDQQTVNLVTISTFINMLKCQCQIKWLTLLTNACYKGQMTSKI
ncbi:hypothetical protein PVAP13_1NG102419 [Panicum virgatum]|uniref:Uncharacterized protein n=1 Tax=Panicum virgatum TaxID=38727 RepID=A0A8T0WQB0_PANVG|nr:hypothetical protein PVAP13_1NG102419 [Panicum virgatum]